MVGLEHFILEKELYTIIDATNPNMQYLGQSRSIDPPDGEQSFAILRMTISNGITKFRWAGKERFNCKWSLKDTFFT